MSLRRPMGCCWRGYYRRFLLLGCPWGSSRSLQGVWRNPGPPGLLHYIPAAARTATETDRPMRLRLIRAYANLPLLKGKLDQGIRGAPAPPAFRALRRHSVPGGAGRGPAARWPAWPRQWARRGCPHRDRGVPW